MKFHGFELNLLLITTSLLPWLRNQYSSIVEQHLEYCERQLRKFDISMRFLTNFYRCPSEGTLSWCITAWYGNCSAQVCKKQQKVVCTAQTITEANLPSMDSIY
eukprot:g28944.t1